MPRCRVVVMVVAAVVLSGCANGTTSGGPGGPTASSPAGTGTSAAPGSGVATETREVTGFTGVELESVGDLQIDQTGTESLTIEAEPDVLPKLTSDVSGGVLHLGVTPGSSITARSRIVYRLTVADLDSVAVSGAGDVTAANLRAGRLAVEISGTGQVTLAGSADAQVVTISGAGDYDGEDLPTATADVTVSGTGDAVVRVSDQLRATVGGTGSVEYIGDPQVTKSIGGVGSVEQR